MVRPEFCRKNLLVSLQLMAHVHQINASGGGVPKLRVDEAHVGRSGMDGDHQADEVHHGGPRQTLCLYSLEVIEALKEEGHPIFPGAAGENLTLTGLDWSAIGEGQRLSIGDELVIEITDPATPCSKNAGWFVDGDFRRMSDKAHPGWSRWYALVVEPGTVKTNDPVRESAAPIPR
jgi:MOSC domain-containing protein YiiM